MEHHASAGERTNVNNLPAVHAKSGEIVRVAEVGGVDVMLKCRGIFISQVQRPEGRRYRSARS